MSVAAAATAVLATDPAAAATRSCSGVCSMGMAKVVTFFLCFPLFGPAPPALARPPP